MFLWRKLSQIYQQLLIDPKLLNTTVADIILYFFFNYFSDKVMLDITKTCLCNFDHLKPHFYIVKLGFIGVYIIFHISAQNIDCGYLLELPHQGSSNEHPHSIFWAKYEKYWNFFFSENFHFLVVKFSVYLNRHVFIMTFPVICLLGRGFTRNGKLYFLWKIIQTRTTKTLS